MAGRTRARGGAGSLARERHEAPKTTPDFYLDLFSPETYRRFSDSDRTVSGFRERHRTTAKRVARGDVLVCYMTVLSRWIGLLEIVSGPFEDSTPRFVEESDPFLVRFNVKPLVWLTPEHGVPIHDDRVWHALSFTREHEKTSGKWTGNVRGSLNRLAADDGAFLQRLLMEQARAPTPYPLAEQEARAMATRVVRRPEGAVSVTIPDDADGEAAAPQPRESIKIQALLARIGATMGHKVWIPTNDRGAVLRELAADGGSLVDKLPLNYDTNTLDTIERIDVLWLRGRSIVRAFEVEHTTAIYSGILRMADLLSLQPNMDIKLHIVAPETRKAKVFDEIRRPVFSLIERRPLAKTCTFLSYDSVKDVADLEHLAHTSDSVLDEYAEEAE